MATYQVRLGKIYSILWSMSQAESILLGQWIGICNGQGRITTSIQEQ